VFAYLPALDAADAGYAVVTERFLCLLGSETSVEAVRELYRALDADPVHLDAVLDAIVARHNLEHFAIVETLDAEQRTLNIAVRGRVTANLDGSTTTRLSGPTGATWITGEARGVTTLALSLDTGVAGTEPLPVRGGVVRALSVSRDTLETDAAEPVFVDEPSPATVPIDLPRLRAAAAAAKEAPAKAGKPAKAPVEESLAAAARDAQPAPRATRIDMAAMAGPPPGQPEPAAAATLLIRLPDGNELGAETPIVIGRRPWSVESDTLSAVHVAVPSPKREVSATHLEVAEIDGTLSARDLGSTNGTVVISPSRPPRLLDGRRSTELVEGDVLDLGEGFHIVIVNGSTH
jgi:hypothetical protein